MRAFVLVVVAALLAVAGGCEEQSKTCYPGDYLGCTCAGGANGYALCSPSGDFASSTCVCNGTTPGIDGGTRDAAADARADAADAGACVPDAGGDAGLKKYFEPCTTSAECETCVCENFGGSLKCTTTCTSVDQCPAPADACTNRGVCRPPQ